MKAKKSKVIMGVVAVTLILSAYGFGYHRGYLARGTVIRFERDTGDTPVQASTKTESEPYFTKANPVPTKVK